MGEVLHISAGARGVQTMDQVRGINVREGLSGEYLDTAGVTEVFHQISLSTISTEDVGNLRSTPSLKYKHLTFKNE